jgi:hypothetical protein
MTRASVLVVVAAGCFAACVAPSPPWTDPPNDDDAGLMSLDAGVPGVVCAPVPTTADAGSGYVICGEFEPLHRVQDVACVEDAAPDQPVCDPTLFVVDGGSTVATECMTDEDCTDDRYGRCVPNFYGEDGCFCAASPCAQDDDCGAEGACGCNETNWEALLSERGIPAYDPGSIERSDLCLMAECRTDADCGDGACMLSPDYSSCGMRARHLGLFCTTDEDECRSDSDCAWEDCVFDEGLRLWRCEALDFDCWA